MYDRKKERNRKNGTSFAFELFSSTRFSDILCLVSYFHKKKWKYGLLGTWNKKKDTSCSLFLVYPNSLQNHLKMNTNGCSFIRFFPRHCSSYYVSGEMFVWCLFRKLFHLIALFMTCLTMRLESIVFVCLCSFFMNWKFLL